MKREKRIGNAACRWCLLWLSVFMLMVFGRGMTVRAEILIRDDAGLFYFEEIQEIREISEQIDKRYRMNILVATTLQTRGKSSADYLEQLYEDAGLADNDAAGGVALVIDLDNRELNLVTERDMIYYITDAREEEIYDAGYEEVSREEYGKSMLAMLKKVQDFLGAGIPGNQYTYDIETGRIVRHRAILPWEAALAFAAAFLCGFLVCLVIYRRYTVVKPYRYAVEQNAEIRITDREDRLVNQFVTHRRIPKNPPPSGGSGGGGRTSVHQSSGGHSFGGGHGRKF